MTENNIVEQLFAKLSGAFAENTIRAYRSDYADFANWCEHNNGNPLDDDHDSLYRYLEELAQTHSTATIGRRIATLSSIYHLLNLKDITKHSDIALLFKKIRRKKGSAQVQAEPLTKDLIKQLLPHCGTGITKKRNHVLLHLGHQTMRRRSELCQFKFDDLKVFPGDRYGINIRFSKTDQIGRGKTIPITKELYELLLTWQKKVGDGYMSPTM